MPGKVCFVVITSDKGLAGSLNSAVIRKVEAEMTRLDLDKRDVVMIGIGRRGADYFTNRGYEVTERHENVADTVSESDVKTVTDKVLQLHGEWKASDVHVAYTNFLSTFEQEAVVRKIVPVTPEIMAEMVRHIRPVKGKYAPSAEGGFGQKPAAYTVEPDAESIVSFLLPKLLNVAILHAVLENKASEHSARMVAMKNATDNAKEKAREYTRRFNKVRQAAITREISEITSGIEAMR